MTTGDYGIPSRIHRVGVGQVPAYSRTFAARLFGALSVTIGPGQEVKDIYNPGPSPLRSSLGCDLRGKGMVEVQPWP